ncbi:ATP-binding protein [Sinanaerobacter chloroacetimidivorans]|uniref:ATP-binding protein n=1 Tax=Sinanaerobacter chloroacetimidivorans TaxID=2818044 RepID=A0A8J8B3I6_9FIRM|nr:ATP-binding protein [Sinanaerobacter chloroacetimidivorans]MBR0599797.1 ATP-binding protein [Sinanaerobacter chloroacetimidivorans]
MPELLLNIEDAKSHNQYSEFMKGLQSTRLLILDDIGLKSYSLEESRDILKIAESRYNRGSMILAGQISHGQWYELFPDSNFADAIMDRIIHNSYILELDSKILMREVMTAKKMRGIDEF